MTVHRTHQRPAVAPSTKKPAHGVSAGEVRAFLVTAKTGKPLVEKTGVGFLLNDTRINSHSIFTGGLRGEGTAAQQAKAKKQLAEAPAWIRKIAGDPLKVHRLASFPLPGAGNHQLWFVETQNYKGGWYVDGSKSPTLVNMPGAFRPGKPNEDIWVAGF